MPFSATEGDFRVILGVLHRVHKLSQSLAEETKVWEECVLKTPRSDANSGKGEHDDDSSTKKGDDDRGADNEENPPPLQPVLVPSQLLSIMRDLRSEMISVLRLQG